jgi:hypothetical protein
VPIRIEGFGPGETSGEATGSKGCGVIEVRPSSRGAPPWRRKTVHSRGERRRQSHPLDLTPVTTWHLRFPAASSTKPSSVLRTAFLLPRPGRFFRRSREYNCSTQVVHLYCTAAACRNRHAWSTNLRMVPGLQRGRRPDLRGVAKTI